MVYPNVQMYVPRGFVSYFSAVNRGRGRVVPLCQRERGGFKRNLFHLCECQKRCDGDGKGAGGEAEDGERKPELSGDGKDGDDGEFTSGIK